jgi:hypothetical protein
MSIEYTVHNDGRVVHAIAHETVNDKDIVRYKNAIANDERIKPWADELVEISTNCIVEVTYDGILNIIEQIKMLSREAIFFRCAISIPDSEKEKWEIAKLYWAMVQPHSPNTIVTCFNDTAAARTWLGIEEH